MPIAFGDFLVLQDLHHFLDFYSTEIKLRQIRRAARAAPRSSSAYMRCALQKHRLAAAITDLQQR